MRRRTFVGGAVAGTGITGAYAKPAKVKAGDIPSVILGRTGEKVTVIAQGGARMDLHPTVQDAAEHVRRVYDLGVTYFDCAASYWSGKAEEANSKNTGYADHDFIVAIAGSNGYIRGSPTGSKGYDPSSASTVHPPFLWLFEVDLMLNFPLDFH